MQVVRGEGVRVLKQRGSLWGRRRSLGDGSPAEPVLVAGEGGFTWGSNSGVNGEGGSHGKGARSTMTRMLQLEQAEALKACGGGAKGRCCCRCCSHGGKA